MKKIVAFLGSPGRNGNTGLIVDRLADGIRTAGLEAEIIHLSDYRIGGCKGCLSCSRTGNCVIDDDMVILYPKIEEADIYIFASPTYNYNMTSEMKALIDRMFRYYRFSNATWPDLLGDAKKAYLVSVCAGPGSQSDPIEEDNMGFTVQGMRRPLEDLEIKVVGEIRYYNTKKFPVVHNKEYQQELILIGSEFKFY